MSAPIRTSHPSNISAPAATAWPVQACHDRHAATPQSECTRSPPSATSSMILPKSSPYITPRSNPPEKRPSRPWITKAPISASDSASSIADLIAAISPNVSAFALPSSRCSTITGPRRSIVNASVVMTADASQPGANESWLGRAKRSSGAWTAGRRDQFSGCESNSSRGQYRTGEIPSGSTRSAPTRS